MLVALPVTAALLGGCNTETRTEELIQARMDAERANIVPSRRGLYARRAIAAGDTIAGDAVIALRPAVGLDAAHVFDLVGLRAVRDLAEGAAFQPGDLAGKPGEPDAT